jgi:PAS domain-containing protein
MQIVMGLVTLAFCVLSLAQTFKLFPDVEEGSLRNRSIISEMAAIQAASAVNHSDVDEFHDFLEILVRRYEDVRSAGLRKADGSLVTQTALHERNWDPAKAAANTPSQIRIPILSNQKSWGELEICFKPLDEPATWLGWFAIPMVRAATFLLAAFFLLFWIYLSRMLRMLDPSSAVPDRMQLLLDTMVEGMVILDTHDNIVMANESFAAAAFTTVNRLIGQKLSALPWQTGDENAPPETLPWRVARQSQLQQRRVQLRLKIGMRHVRSLAINVSPILGPRGALCGILVTFDDQTVIEVENLQMAQVVTKIGVASDGLHQLQRNYHQTADQQQRLALDAMIQTIDEVTQLCNSAFGESSALHGSDKSQNTDGVISPSTQYRSQGHAPSCT